MHTVVKIYRDLPAAHRQPNHHGHCALIHGHNWSFEIEFGAKELDNCGFVVDLGGLQAVKDFLTYRFDHTLLLNLDDPLLKVLPEGFAKITLVPNCGMEGLAELVYATIVHLIEFDHILGRSRGLQVVSVVCREDSKNSAMFRL